jgi:hypothetical protein
VYGAFSIAGVHYGTGRHHNDLSLEGIHRARNYWWYCYLFYCVSTISSKLSIGWFLLRIAIKRIHIFIIHSAMFVTVVAGLAFFFVTFFQCNPISYFWNKTQPGTCIDDSVVKALGYLYSTFSIISDLTFALVPAVLVWDLQLKMRTKVALIPLLTMGCMYVYALHSFITPLTNNSVLAALLRSACHMSNSCHLLTSFVCILSSKLQA